MARIQLSGTQIPTLSRLNIDGSFTLDAASGTTGQILISQGSGNTPAWTSSPNLLEPLLIPLSTVGGAGSEGGQISFGRVSDGAQYWYIDSYGSTASPDLRFIEGATERFRLKAGGVISAPGFLDVPGIARSGSSALAFSTSNLAVSTGSISLTTGNVTSAGSAGSINLEVGSTVGGGSAGAINIGIVNAPSAITIGKTGVTTTFPGVVTVTQTLTGGNLTTGGTLTRTILAGGGATTASIDNNGRFIRTTSSARYKDSIEDANYAYEDVISLSPKTFKLKDEIESETSPRTYAGFIAEDVHEIDSLRVFVNYLTQEDGSKIPDGIAYGEMVSALVSAIKHQDTLIKSLETRIEQLENQ